MNANNIISFVLLSISFQTMAQTVTETLRGKVIDSSGQTIISANISLTSYPDSITLYTAADNEGRFKFFKLSKGTYNLLITSIGYQDYTETIRVDSQISSEVERTFILKSKSQQLKEVIVTSKAPSLVVKPDRVTLNVDADVNSVGLNVLELLRKLPGVRVYDEVILINGKNGLSVYQDGKNINLTGRELISYLRSISSSSVSSVEIITSPSSKFDAAGNTGIINIQMKRNDKLGTAANFTYTGSYSKFNPKYDGSVNYFYRNSVVNLLFSYTLSKGNYKSTSSYNRSQEDQFGKVSYFDQTYNQYSSELTHNIRTGVDFSITKKDKAGIQVDANLAPTSTAIYSKTYIYQNKGSIDSVLFASNKMPQDLQRVNFDAFYAYFDSGGRQVNVTASFGVFHLPSTSSQQNDYRDESGNILTVRDFYNEIATTIKSGAFKADFSKPAFNGILGIGLKASWVSSDNNSIFFNGKNNNASLDTGKTNHFTYDEKIQAIYLDYQRHLKRLFLRTGVRFEVTESSSILKSLLPQPVRNQRIYYSDVFPYASANYNINKKNSVVFFYSRRIDRPDYRSLNPFILVLDELSYIKGNPFLRPQYTNSLKLVHNYQETLTSSISYSNIAGYILTYRDTLEDTKTVQTKINIEAEKIYTLSITGRSHLSHWGELTVVANAFDRHVRGMANSAYINTSYLSWSTIINQRVQLPHQFSFEISGFYNSKYLDAPALVDGQWSIDCGIQKKILKNHGNIAISVSDLFNTYKFTLNRNFGGLNYSNRIAWESRMLKVSFAYKFGSKNIKENITKESSLDAERKRIK
jgi:hypothetical protein